MNTLEIESTARAAFDLLTRGRMKSAFDKIKILTDELQWGTFNDQINEYIQNYRFLLQYFAEGTDDPERKSVYNKLAAKSIHLTGRLKDELLLRNAVSYEYSLIRVFPHKLHFSAVSDMFDSLQYYHQQTENTNFLHDFDHKRLRSNFEKLLPDLFLIFWLTIRFEQDEKQVFRKIIKDEYQGKNEQSLIIAALTLNLWRTFDEEKLLLLLDACLITDIQIRQRALVGLVFVLTKYNKLMPYFPSIRNRLVLLGDNLQIFDNLKNIIMLIIGSTDTDKITRRMQEEIIPEMMKMSPAIRNKMQDFTLKNDDLDDENPEWQEILEQSGIADKLQEISELQLEGADVYMSTFSMLKSFPFFNEVSNWLLPFDPEMLSVNELFKNNEKNFLTAFLNNSIICNSDKYSFSLSILQMPESQREMVSRTFQAESGQLEEIAKDENLIKPGVTARNAARQYIQDLFRFFRLYPQHKEFQSMFDYALEIHETSFFDLLSAENDLEIHVAEYYFTKKHYPESIALFDKIIENGNQSAAIFQKLGFAHYKTNQSENALDAYLKADMILPDDVWTIRKIAQTYRMLGRFDKALEHYRHLEFLQPGKLNPKMQIASCLTSLGKFKEALSLYQELEQTEPENEKIWKAVAQCAFLSGNLFQADYYAEKLNSINSAQADLLLTGHIAFCLKKNKIAFGYYQEVLSRMNDNIEMLLEYFESDEEALLKNGISKEEILLMIDELTYYTESL